jgi:hypothetical protein
MVNMPPYDTEKALFDKDFSKYHQKALKIKDKNSQTNRG